MALAPVSGTGQGRIPYGLAESTGHEKVASMVNLRSRRIGTMLGAPFDQLNAQHVKALPESGVTEDVDLDFKRDTYWKAEKSTRELAKDVAAFANTAVGVVVIGVGDDAQGRAASPPGTTSPTARCDAYDSSSLPWCSAAAHGRRLADPGPRAGPGQGLSARRGSAQPSSSTRRAEGRRPALPRRHGTTT